METVAIKTEFNSDEENDCKESVTNLMYDNNSITNLIGKDIKFDIDIEEHVLDQPEYVNANLCGIKQEPVLITKKYKCKLCPFHSNFSGNLRRHLVSLHSHQRFCCYYCDYETNRKCNLIKHQERKHSCMRPAIINGFEGERNKLLLTRSDPTSVENIKKMFTVVDTDPFTPKIYICSTCQFKTVKNSNIYSHIKSKHVDPKALKYYKCDFCDYKSIRNTTLNKHIRNKHTKKSHLKYFRCEICEFQTYHKYSFTQHIKKEHTGVVECKICSCKVIGKYDLHLHMQEQHYNNLQLYQCSNCDFRCYRKKNISRHIATYHVSA